MAYKKNKSSKVAYQREKYIQKRMSQLEKLGFTKEEILGRAKDESSFWSSKRNYDSFRKRANQMAKGLRQEEKRINQEIERRVSLIDESKIKFVIMPRIGILFGKHLKFMIGYKYQDNVNSFVYGGFAFTFGIKKF